MTFSLIRGHLPTCDPSSPKLKSAASLNQLIMASMPRDAPVPRARVRIRFAYTLFSSQQIRTRGAGPKDQACKTSSFKRGRIV